MNTSRLISRAIIRYYHGGAASPPWKRERRVMKKYGDKAPELLEQINRLTDDFYSTMSIGDETTREAAERAALLFNARHPEIAKKAVKRLENDYWFNNK